MTGHSKRLRWILFSLAAILAALLAGGLLAQSLNPNETDATSAGTTDTSATTAGNETTSGSQASESTQESSSPSTTPETTVNPVDNGLEILKGMIVDPLADPLRALSNQTNSGKINFYNRYFRQNWNASLKLFMSTSEARPESVPEITAETRPYAGAARTVYSRTPYDSIITDTGSQIRWFSILLPAGSAGKAARILWQVSLLPFDGREGTGGPVYGLLLSGILDPGAQEFNIDFAKVRQAEKRLQPTGGSIAHPAAASGSAVSDHHLRVYYVRAFPVDERGKSVGDTGSGLAVLYGRPAIQQTSQPVSFKLLSAREQGELTAEGDNPNELGEYEIRDIVVEKGKIYHVQPLDISDQATALVLQVARAPFSLQTGGWDNPAGLVHEHRISIGEPLFDELRKSSGTLQIDFSAFAPADSDLPEETKLSYYIRIIALAPGDSPVFEKAIQVSATLQINYGHEKAGSAKETQEITISSHIPQVTAVTYTPVKFEAVNWAYRYVTVRQPTLMDIFGELAANGDDIVPDLPAGSEIDFYPVASLKQTGWKELLESAILFSKGINAYYLDLATWSAGTYDQMQSLIPQAVADQFPDLPDDSRARLTDALLYMVDYEYEQGGLPPTLPAFSSTTGLFAEYLAVLALNKAGLSAADLGLAGLPALTDVIRSCAAAIRNSAGPNPMNWDFLQVDPQFFYQPACLLIELYNSGSEPTPEGRLSGSAIRELGTAGQASDPEQKALHDKFGENIRCLIYRPVAGLVVPSLAPGQKLAIPVFLDEYINQPYYTNGLLADGDNFRQLYWKTGKASFSFTIEYNLPDIADVARELGYGDDAICRYHATESTIGFTIEPYLSWQG